MDIKTKLLNKELVTGLWVQSGSPVVTEIMAEAGMDFITADMEHSDINEAALSGFIRALQGKAAAFARVRENSTIAIRRALDCGATGIIVPLVNSAQDAQNAVAACRYPPEGVRGYAFCRANHWGLSFDEYAREANGRITVIVMVETAAAVAAIDEILAVDGVDGVLVGPYDLSGSFGVPGQLNHERVRTAKRTVLEACLRHGKAAGQHIVTPTDEEVAAAVAEGYTFLPLGMDTVFVAAGAQNVRAMATRAVQAAQAPAKGIAL